MASTTHGDAKPIVLDSHDEDLWDENIEALLASGDIEGARAEFERQTLASLNSGDPVSLEEAVKHRLPGYTVDLLLEKGDIPAAKAELERLLLEGISSEGSIEATPQFFDNLRKDIHRKTQAKVASKSA